MAAKFRVLVCRGPSCGDQRQSSRVADEFVRILREQNLCNIEMAWQSCFGRCTRGPNVLVRKVRAQEPVVGFGLATVPPSRAGGRATMYNHVTPADVSEIVSEHLELGKPVRRLMEIRKKPVAEKDGDT